MDSRFDDFGISDFKRELEFNDFTIEGHPEYILRFVYGQIDVKIVNKDHRQRLNYQLFKRGKDIIMSCSPHLLDEPGEMKAEVTKNHIRLSNLNNPDNFLVLTKLSVK